MFQRWKISDLLWTRPVSNYFNFGGVGMFSTSLDRVIGREHCLVRWSATHEMRLYVRRAEIRRYTYYFGPFSSSLSHSPSKPLKLIALISHLEWRTPAVLPFTLTC